MTHTALLRFTPAFGLGTLTDPSPRALVVQRGALVPLSLERPVPVVIDHDEARQVGVVKDINIFPDVHGGVVRDWYFASVELEDPPDWLKVNGGVSWAHNTLQVQDIGEGRRRLLRGIIREISILSPGTEPAERLARVVLLERTSSSAAGDASARPAAANEVVIYGDGSVIRRPGGEILGVR